MTEGGPYKKIAEELSAISLRKIEERIKKMDKVSIPLPEDLREKATLPMFYDAITDRKVKPEEIVLYSAGTGILKYRKGYSTGDSSKSYHYTNEGTPPTELVISLNEILQHAMVVGISTIEDSELLKKPEQKKNQLSIAEMRETIAKGNKLGFELAEDIKPNYNFEILNDYFSVDVKGGIKNFNPDEIVFYSEKFGILKFDHKEKPEYGNLTFYWSDEEKSNVLEVVFIGDWDEDPFYLKSITEDGIKTIALSGEEDDEGKLHYQESKIIDGKTKIIRDYRA